MELQPAGGRKKILEQNAASKTDGLLKVTKDEWEKLKVDFDIIFTNYLQKLYKKYSKVKTLLYQTEPKALNDFFVTPMLQKEPGNSWKAKQLKTITSISNFIIIEGRIGSGKSTLMKHFLLRAMEQREWIPIFMELREINDLTEPYELSELLLEQLNVSGADFNQAYLETLLRSGCFLFLLDGYDEIAASKRSAFFKKLVAFCDRYADNCYMISSRPCSGFMEFQRFTILTLCPFSREQTLSLVNRAGLKAQTKQRFLTAWEGECSEKFQPFVSNPLLLNSLLASFDWEEELPKRLHFFYANAFELLCIRHDASKAGYRRKLRSHLPYESFCTVFAGFCFTAYVQERNGFSGGELEEALRQVSTVVCKTEFEIRALIEDLVHSLCLLYKEGMKYHFTQRPFQQYFAAVYLKNLPDEAMSKIGLELIRRNPVRAAKDEVFELLYQMDKERFERNILLPVLEEYEQQITIGSKFDFYFKHTVSGISFFQQPGGQQPLLENRRGYMANLLEFIYQFARHYMEKNALADREDFKVEEGLFHYLIEEIGYEVRTLIEGKNILKDEQMFDLFRTTWMGERIELMSNLSDRLKEKQRKDTLDLLF